MYLGKTERIAVRPNAFGNKYVFKQDREDSRGSGILLATKRHLQTKVVGSFTVNSCECVPHVDCTETSNYLRFAVVYRSLNTSCENSLALFDKLLTYLGKCKYFPLHG